MKRVFSVLLVIVMLFSFSVNSFAVVTELAGMAASVIVGELVLQVVESGGAYIERLFSNPGDDATLVDPNTFMGLSIPAYDLDLKVVSRYMPDDSDYLTTGYSIKVPSNGITSSISYVARDLVIEESGIWHFSNFYGSTVYDAISLYLDGTVATFVCWDDTFDSYEIVVIDYATYAAYTKIINLLSGIAENMGVVEGGSGGSIDTSEMETLLEDIDSSLSQVLPYLSALNQNIIDTENYVSELSTTLDNVSSDISGIESAVSSIGGILSRIQPLLSATANNTKNTYTELQSINEKITECMELTNSILTTISEDVRQIKDDVAESKGILATIRDKIDDMHTSIVNKLDSLISAVRGIGSVSGGGSSGSDGGSFVSDLLGVVFGVVFEALKLLLNLVFNLLSSLLGWIIRLSAYAASFFGGIIPADVLAILAVAPTLSLILGVVKFIRG